MNKHNKTERLTDIEDKWDCRGSTEGGLKEGKRQLRVVMNDN